MSNIILREAPNDSVEGQHTYVEVGKFKYQVIWLRVNFYMEGYATEQSRVWSLVGHDIILWVKSCSSVIYGTQLKENNRFGKLFDLVVTCVSGGSMSGQPTCIVVGSTLCISK